MPNVAAESSRNRLLTAAEELLREVGMAGTGIKDVVARSGAPIGSVYHHFPGGKTQLVSESLQIHAEKSRRLLASFFEGRRSAAAAIRMLFDTAADGFERAGANKGCAIGTVTLDLTNADASIREVCRATVDSWVAVIAPHLPWPDERRRRSFAQTIITVLEGAFIVGRAMQSGDPFRESGKWLAAMVELQPPGNQRVRRQR
jgi:AcrR family transcriptional regulator